MSIVCSQRQCDHARSATQSGTYACIAANRSFEDALSPMPPSGYTDSQGAVQRCTGCLAMPSGDIEGADPVQTDAAFINTHIPGGLTPREAEIMGLVADGKSNQQIADSLSISRHTVIRHVSNIFQKTGVTNRVEAALLASRYGVTH